MIAAKSKLGVKTSWAEQKAKLRSAFPKLTDEDMNFEEIGIEEMLRKLEVKLAITVSELKTIMRNY